MTDMQQFTGKSVYPGQSLEWEQGALTISAMIEHDSDHGAPWDECDGHGPVSEWTRRAKRPGEFVLNRDRDSFRYYDFQEACRIARRDRWGVSPYRMDMEQGANGLVRCNAQWFDSRNNMECIATGWHDCPNAARAQAYALHRASMSPREYAARAAMSDYQFLRDWCNDEWCYIGLVITVTHTESGTELGSDSIWGIESCSVDTVNDYLPDCVSVAIEYRNAGIVALA